MKKLIQFLAPSAVVFAGIFLVMKFAHGRTFEWGVGFVFLAPIVVLAAIHGFWLPEDYLKRWSKAHGVQLTDENRGLILPYLRRGRRIRSAGALIGYVTYSIVIIQIGGDHAGVGWLRATFGGYLLGAAVAEFWAFRPEPGAPRAASLVPREIDDYVPSPAIALMRVTMLLIALVALAQPFVPSPHRSIFASHGVRPAAGYMLGWTGIAFVLALVIEATARRIVRRPQPASSPVMVAADDAIRTTAMHGLIGAGSALLLGILAHMTGPWQNYLAHHRTDLAAAYGIVTVFAYVFGVFSWLRLGIDQPWIVRRSQQTEQVAA